MKSHVSAALPFIVALGVCEGSPTRSDCAAPNPSVPCSIRGGSYLPSYLTKKSLSFKTWSFDEPCDSMEWTSLPETTLDVCAVDEMEDSELTVFGVMAPPRDGDDDVSDGDDEEEAGEGASSIELTGKAMEMNQVLGGLLSESLEENFKEFKDGAVIGSMTPIVRVSVVDHDNVLKIRRFAFIGLGKSRKHSGDDAQIDEASLGRKVGSAIASVCSSEKSLKTCSVVLPGAHFGPASISDLSTAFTEGLYSDNRYRTGSRKKAPSEKIARVSLALDGETAAAASRAKEAVASGRKMALGSYLARDIVNSPHNVLNSVSLADTARRLAAESRGRLQCHVLDKRECEKRGMGAYLGVARGSETEPQFIHIVYKPRKHGAGDSCKKVGLVGKGLLFDTGGYNIKTSMMELMKFDCGGAAAVLGAARAVAALGPDGVEAHFVVAACENMISDRSVVPGDVLIASNGKTIEVVNTDAEGRLTMADALVYVDREIGCEKIIELSTLTGACMVALGGDISALYAADDDLATALENISKATGEKLWRMPLEKEYNEQLQSKIADLKNLGNKYGGSITAALFLQNFVNKKKPFAHIDMAGPVWNTKSGATGYGAKMVATWVCQQGQPPVA